MVPMGILFRSSHDASMSEGMELEARNTRESAQRLHDELAPVVRPLPQA